MREFTSLSTWSYRKVLAFLYTSKNQKTIFQGYLQYQKKEKERKDRERRREKKEEEEGEGGKAERLKIRLTMNLIKEVQALDREIRKDYGR